MSLTCDVNIISSVGLLLDIAGVVMLFIYGLPSKASEGGMILLEESDRAEVQRRNHNARIKRRATSGLILLILGFILQLLGSNFHLRM